MTRVTKETIVNACRKVGLNPIPETWRKETYWDETRYGLRCEGGFDLSGTRTTGDDPEFHAYVHLYEHVAKIEALGEVLDCPIYIHVVETARARAMKEALAHTGIYVEAEQELWDLLRKYDMIKGEDEPK